MIQKIVDDFLLAEQEKRKDRVRSGCFTPSSFGRCFRFQYWRRKGEPETNPSGIHGLRVMSVGTLFHKWIQDKLGDVQSEVEVKTDDVFGYADIVMGDTVWDIKTVSPYDIDRMYKAGYNVEEQKYTNILQVMSYAYLLNKPRGGLIFVSRADLRCAEFTFETEMWRGDIEQELERLRADWKKGLLPMPRGRCYISKSGEIKECTKYCSYRDKCKEISPEYWATLKGVK